MGTYKWQMPSSPLYIISALPEYLRNEKEPCDDNGDTSCDDECVTESDCRVLSSSASESDE